MKILLVDIETSPNVAHVWGLWQQNVSTKQIMESSYTLCWSAKWAGDTKIYYASVQKSTPEIMLSKIHKLLDEADAVVHYNGTKFDIPTLNKEFLLYGFAPPSPYKQVDLLRTMRGSFRFPSNKLDYVVQRLGLGSKTAHEGHELWVKCMAGEKDAWKKMEEYNKQDVVLLEKVYNKVMPWIKNHPNHNLYEDGAVCPKCGSQYVQRRGVSKTLTLTYQRFQCQDCGSWSQGTKKEDHEVHLKGIA